jgi:hypothetical protein
VQSSMSAPLGHCFRLVTMGSGVRWGRREVCIVFMLSRLLKVRWLELSARYVLSFPVVQCIGGHGMLTSSTKIVHAGKRLCLLTGIMKREKDGQVVATCEHNKYNIDIEESKM